MPRRAAYPPGGHPEDRSFAWEKGRTLRHLQILYITEGEGSFESTTFSLTKISAGTTILVLPGMWHRYRPDPEIGWSESWLEVQGPYVEDLRKNGVMKPEQCLFRSGQDTGGAGGMEIAGLFASAARIAHERAAGFQVRLGLLAMQILTLLTWQTGRGQPSARNDVVSEAIRLMSANPAQPVSPAWVARRLHTSYSHFRRLFKAQTGFSPKVYQMHWRYRHACELLRHTNLPLKDIAERLGYDSAYHLSHAFKKINGESPQHWRLKTTD